MPIARCVAVKQNGLVCGRLADVYDELRGGRVCPLHRPRPDRGPGVGRTLRLPRNTAWHIIQARIPELHFFALERAAQTFGISRNRAIVALIQIGLQRHGLWPPPGGPGGVEGGENEQPRTEV